MREAAQGRRATIVTDRPRFEHSSSFAYILSLLELLEQAEAQGRRAAPYLHLVCG